MRGRDLSPLILPLFLLLLRLLGFHYVVALTDSMEPAVPRGSLVITAPPWLTGVGEGYIALFKLKLGENEYMILHRVVSIGDYVRTKGDNRAFTDPWILDARDIIGVAVIVIPYAGFPLLLLRSLIIPIIVGVCAFHLVLFLLSPDELKG